MASSSILTTLFMSVILFSSQNNVVTSSRPTPGPSSNSPFEQVCLKSGDPKYCVQFLQTKPQVQSAKTVHDATIGMLEWGISNVTSVIGHVKMSLNKPGIAPNVKAALEQCTRTYEYINGTFHGTITSVKRDNDKEKLASYDIHSASYDDMRGCTIALANAKVADDTIVNTNDALQEIGVYASTAIDNLLPKA